MPSGDDIQSSLLGAWRMMMGRADGLRLLDLSADGFWNSFFAMVVALPAFVVSWVALANDMSMGFDFAGSRLSLVLRLALVDLAAWLVPLGLLALAARPAGIASRLVHYVVASNWASAIIVWLMMPPALIRLFSPDAQELTAALSLGLFLFTLVLSWRLTNIAIGKGPGMATAVFAGMVAASIVTLVALQAVLGLAPEM